MEKAKHIPNGMIVTQVGMKQVLLKRGYENRSKQDIDRLLSWHCERLFRKHSVQDNMDVYERLCEDFATLPVFEFDHWQKPVVEIQCPLCNPSL